MNNGFPSCLSVMEIAQAPLQQSLITKDNSLNPDWSKLDQCCADIHVNASLSSLIFHHTSGLTSDFCILCVQCSFRILIKFTFTYITYTQPCVSWGVCIFKKLMNYFKVKLGCNSTRVKCFLIFNQPIGWCRGKNLGVKSRLTRDAHYGFFFQFFSFFIFVF